MKRFCVIMLLATSLGTAWGNNGNEFEGVVTAIVDGNTLEITKDNSEAVKVKLYGIECPEMGQDFSQDAKAFLEKKLLKKNVTVQIQGKDRKGTPLAIVLDTKKKQDPRIELLKEGLAWTAERNPLSDLEDYRLQAQQKKVGLWKDEQPTPPWTYRRQQSMMTAKSS